MITVRLEHSILKMDDNVEYHWARNFFVTNSLFDINPHFLI